ncbi:MAG: nucleotidyltransferase, partial [Bacteroidetes bacterium]|nr:nucleotidyltransferase [Bacteroidota bacterium]
FADKWAENPEKEELFFEWLNRAKRDFDQLAQKRGLPELAVPLQQYFGENIVKKALNEVAEQTLKEREANRLFMAAGTGILSSQQTPKSVPVTQHNPYGSDKG